MASFDLDTGKMIDGLDELFQSIEVICVTPKGRRKRGSNARASAMPACQSITLNGPMPRST
jgi:hypothetical protein